MTGTVTDSQPSSVAITFGGAANGTALSDATGHFSFTTANALLGIVSAVGVDGANQVSNSLTASITDTAPNITLNITNGSQRTVTISGKVVEESSAGLTVTFGGLPSLIGKTATVASDGTFRLTSQLQTGENGEATAQTTDWYGQQSAIAWVLVESPLSISNMGGK